MTVFDKLRTFVSSCPRNIAMLGLALLLGLLLSSLAPALDAHAGFSSCDGDPIITLSNGDKVQLNVHLNIPASSVNQVEYTLHAPAGTSVVSIEYTPGLANKEGFVFVADNATNQLDADTIAYTNRHARVTAFMSKSMPGTTSGLISKTTIGSNSQDIHSRLSW